MKYIIAGVEGEVTEPAGIVGALNSLKQQSPLGYAHLEVVPLSLGGNHGHGEVLILKYKEEVEKYLNNPEHCVESDDEICKFLVCDDDGMAEYGVEESVFRKKVVEIGAIPIISKPNFEYFVARLFWDENELTTMLRKRMGLNDIIRRGIEEYNKTCKYDFQMVSPYMKKHHQTEDWFWRLFDMNPEFLRRAINTSVDIRREYYTEVPLLLKEIAEHFY